MIADSGKPNKLRNVYPIRITARNVTFNELKINATCEKIEISYKQINNEPNLHIKNAYLLNGHLWLSGPVQSMTDLNLKGDLALRNSIKAII